MASAFSRKLMAWYDLNKRSLPWMETRDAYKIWLSEIILQQTRVEQGIPYYLKFIKKYPNVLALASAKEDHILKDWEGLGYYSRARNLHFAANQILNQHKGIFPRDFESVKQLKGIGNYTASAILSYAFDLPYAAVDSNAIRIITRYFGVTEPIESNAGKKLVALHAQKLLDKTQPGKFNQAMMDFGSLVCTPRNPACEECPFQKECVAYNSDMVSFFPVKEKKLSKRIRYFNYLVFLTDKKIIITPRESNDIWKNLYQFPLLESKNNFTLKTLIQVPEFKEMVTEKPISTVSTDVYVQQLTHQTIHTRFFIITVSDLKDIRLKNVVLTHFGGLKKYAFPGVIRDFLQRNTYF